MAKSQSSMLDTIEKQIEGMLTELTRLRRERGELNEQISELEAAIESQSTELERMQAKISASARDLDIRYRRKREEIQSRLNHVLAKLESL